MAASVNFGWAAGGDGQDNTYSTLSEKQEGVPESVYELLEQVVYSEWETLITMNRTRPAWLVSATGAGTLEPFPLTARALTSPTRPVTF